MRQGLIQSILCIVIFYAAYIDYKTHKIPNKLTFPSMLGGILLNGMFFGLTGIMGSILGIGIGFSFFVLFLIGALKAGDVKLYMAIGAFLGWRLCLIAMIASIIIGGIVGILFLIRHKNGKQRMESLWIYLKTLVFTRQFKMYEPIGEKAFFPFGSCIGAGVLIAVASQFI